MRGGITISLFISPTDSSAEVRTQSKAPLIQSDKAEIASSATAANLLTTDLSLSERLQKRFPTQSLDLNSELLHSGIACLPGNLS